MRRKMFLMVMLMSVLSFASAQEKNTIRKATKNSYVCTTLNSSILIHNQNSKYWEMEPNYNPKAYTMPLPEFILENRKGLLEFIGKNFMPYVKKKQIVFGNNLHIRFNFNMEGVIEEVFFSYPKGVKIPITVIEQLEDYIVHQCRMQFEPNAALEGAYYIFDSVDYTFEYLDRFRDISE